MYRALLNFLYSLESKPLYFPVICKVLKKMQYTNGGVVFTLLSIVNTSGNFFIISHVFGTMCACVSVSYVKNSASVASYMKGRADLEGFWLIGCLISHRGT